MKKKGLYFFGFASDMATHTLQFYADGFVQKLAELRCALPKGNTLDATDFNICCAVMQSLLDFEFESQMTMKIPKIRTPKLESSYKLAMTEFRRLSNLKKHCAEYNIEMAGFFRCGKETLLQCNTNFVPRVASNSASSGETIYNLSIALSKKPFLVSEGIDIVEDGMQVDHIPLRNSIDLCPGVCKNGNDFGSDAVFYQSTVTQQIYVRDKNEWFINTNVNQFEKTVLLEEETVLGRISNPVDVAIPESDALFSDSIWGDVDADDTNKCSENSVSVSTQTDVFRYYPFGIDLTSFE